MIPRLYESTELEFKTNGLGSLPDALSCIVTEERNGCYELEMEYPVAGLHYDLIENNRIILAKPNEISDPQPFDIKEITSSMDKMTVTIYAQHVRYRLNTIPVAPLSAIGIASALDGLKKGSLVSHPFTFWTDIDNTSSQFKSVLPKSLGSLLGGTKGSILDTFSGSSGCEYEFDRFKVKLHAHRGSDSGVSIRYAKNLTGCKMEASIESVYTGVLAFWQKEENGKAQLVQSEIQYIENHTSYPRESVYLLDASSEFDALPTVDQLNSRALSYATKNKIGEPSVSIEVSFIPLWQTEEYKDIAPLERVSLCDTATVVFEQLGVNASALVNKTVYDVLQERYTSISIGSVKSKFSDSIKQEAHDQAEEVKKDTFSQLQSAIDSAVSKIKGGTDGHVILATNANGETNELYAFDGNTLESALKVLRLNYMGIAGTTNGLNGKYNLAVTTSGEINASQVLFGEMNGDRINARTVSIGKLASDVTDELEILSASDLESATTEFYKSNSETIPPSQDASGWQESTFSYDESKPYIWTRTRFKFKGSDIPKYTYPQCAYGTTEKHLNELRQRIKLSPEGLQIIQNNDKTNYTFFKSDGMYIFIGSVLVAFYTADGGNIPVLSCTTRLIVPHSQYEETTRHGVVGTGHFNV